MDTDKKIAAARGVADPKKHPVKARKIDPKALRSGCKRNVTPLIRGAWASSQFFSHSWIAAKLLRDAGMQFHFNKRVVVIDGSPEAYDAMVEQGARAACKDNGNRFLSWEQESPGGRDKWRNDARSVLAAIGITRPKENT